jgi:hypothetical protein
MKIFIILPGTWLLMIFSTLVQLNAQNFEETVLFADRQFENQNYQLAVKEYQRALFFSKGEKTDYLYQQIARAFFKNSQFAQAAYFYDLSYKTSTNDSLKKELTFNKAECYLLMSDYRQSVYELISLGNDLSSYFKGKQDFYLAVSYFGLEEFGKSEAHFIRLVKNEPKLVNEISGMFSRKNLYRPSPKTAKTLSRIIPGTGQLYAGDLKNALNSLVLTGGLAFLGIHVYTEYSLFDSIMSVFPWFYRYYQGGSNKAHKIAHEKREIKRDKTYQSILKVLEKQISSD